MRRNSFSSGTLSSTLTASLNETGSEAGSVVTLVVDIGFHPHELLSSPLNLGSLPLIAIDTSAAAGVTQASVVAVRKGAAPPNATYPEQAVSLRCSAATLAELGGGMQPVSKAHATSK